MPNNKKYRVQDIAADIGADRSAVIELLEGAFEGTKKAQTRSEEHTSELQSPS